jgi:hypothetical protein
MSNRNSLTSPAAAALLACVAASWLIGASCAGAQETRTAVGNLAISFKLDPRITRSLYMGDRWVSPATYSRVGDATAVAVEARASGNDSKGKPVAIRADWVPADTELVTVTPVGDGEVRLTVNGEGETSVDVVAGGVSRTLRVKAIRAHGALQVEITVDR